MWGHVLKVLEENPVACRKVSYQHRTPENQTSCGGVRSTIVDDHILRPSCAKESKSVKPHLFLSDDSQISVWGGETVFICFVFVAFAMRKMPLKGIKYIFIILTNIISQVWSLMCTSSVVNWMVIVTSWTPPQLGTCKCECRFWQWGECVI